MMRRNAVTAFVSALLVLVAFFVATSCDEKCDECLMEDGGVEESDTEDNCSEDSSQGESCVETDFTMTPRPAESRQQIYNREDEFERLDNNSDGFLSAEEYNGTILLFDDMDEDGDGQLSLDEAKYMMTFAEIPAGSFVMGTDDPIKAFFQPATDEGPAHDVNIDGFKMSATEVTNAQYARYLNTALEAGEIVVKLGDAGGPQTRVFVPVPAYAVEGAPGTKFAGKIYTILSPVSCVSHIKVKGNPTLIPEHPLNQSWIRYVAEFERFYVHPGFEDWPAAFIRWYGAKAFSDHYGLDLPTEAEWEYAARGGEQYDFPTSDGTNGGDSSNFSCFNVHHDPDYEGVDTPDKYIGFKLAVGSFPANPYGLFDLAGNVWEWTIDWYREDFYQHCVDNGITSNPVNLEGEEPPEDAQGGPGQPFSHDARVCRGGSYNYHDAVTHNAFRFPVYSFIGNDHFGARVVLRPSTTVFNGND